MENRKINKFEKDVLRHIRTDIDDALKSVCEKYGLVFKIGTIKFTAKEFHTKMTCVIINSENGTMENPDKVIFEQICRHYSLTQADFGSEFIFGTDTYKICGIKMGSKKYPILAKRTDGRIYRFSVPVVKHALDIINGVQL